MRIDSNPISPSLPESRRAGNPAANQAVVPAAGTSSPLGQDQAQLSGLHLQVQALVAQAAQLPETTQDKINALRQAVNRGDYKPSPERVAGALFDSRVVHRAA
jgi:flagellar biosynthesis anti-sigma factor FlgM